VPQHRPSFRDILHQATFENILIDLLIPEANSKGRIFWRENFLTDVKKFYFFGKKYLFFFL
jgi:hypothetical protein